MVVDNKTYFALVEERIANGEQVRIPLVGASMEPTLLAGDELTLAPLDGTLPQVGDIVLFRHAGQHVLHRVVAVQGYRYTMRGDNCQHNEQATSDDIVARLVKVKKKGWLRHFVARWAGAKGRRQLRPLYFLALAFLMWAPLNGVGLPMNNYILGLRLDHLLHASVFIPCVLFLWGVVRPGYLAWMVAVVIGVLTESVQYLLPYRGFDINDMVANALGVTLGWVIVVLCRQAIRKRHRYPRHARHGACTPRRGG